MPNGNGFEYDDEGENFNGLFCPIHDIEIGYEACPECEAEGFISTLISEKPEYELEIYKLLLSKNPIASYGVSRAMAASPISDEAASLVIQTQHVSLLKLLANNPNASDEIKVQLSLLGYKQAKTVIASDVVSLEVDPTSLIFPFSTSQGSNPESLGELSGREIVLPEVANYLYSIGHPYSMLDTKSRGGDPLITEDALLWMIKREYLHRIFWRELTELVDEFDIGYRYRENVSLLFVSHSLLAQDFYDFDLEDLHRTTAEDLIDYPILAGALRGLPERPWTNVNKTVNPFYDDLEEEDRRYDMDDIEVTVNLEFEENLTWKNLQREKQLQLFLLLKTGLLSSNQEIAGASEHFLGCIALHPNTPQEFLDDLGKLGNELIQEVIDSR